MDATRMVRVASARDSFEARIIAARLGAEGIVWELRGNVDGPYPVGEVQVLVEESEAEAARELLSTGADDDDEADGDALGGRPGWVAIVAIGLAVLVGLARLLTAF